MTGFRELRCNDFGFDRRQPGTGARCCGFATSSTSARLSACRGAGGVTGGIDRRTAAVAQRERRQVTRVAQICRTSCCKTCSVSERQVHSCQSFNPLIIINFRTVFPPATFHETATCVVFRRRSFPAIQQSSVFDTSSRLHFHRVVPATAFTFPWSKFRAKEGAASREQGAGPSSFSRSTPPWMLPCKWQAGFAGTGRWPLDSRRISAWRLSEGLPNGGVGASPFHSSSDIETPACLRSMGLGNFDSTCVAAS